RHVQEGIAGEAVMMQCGRGQQTFTNTTVGTPEGTGMATCTGMNPSTFMDISAGTATSTGTTMGDSTSTDAGVSSGTSESTSTTELGGAPRETSNAGWKKVSREAAVVVLLSVQVLVQVLIRALQPSS
ncbi:MAG: hypothetical protein WBL66_10150, partial [Candidatus Acidiferrales bacterium]